MNNSFAPYALDAKRTTTVRFYPGDVTPRDVLLAASTAFFDLTPFVSKCTQTATDAQVRLAWHSELYGANQPRPGKVLEILLEGQSYFIGIIQGVNDYNLASGRKEMTLVVRTRDATPAYRQTHRVTDVFPVSTTLDSIIKSIAYGLGLTDEEIATPTTPLSIVQSNAQLADLTPWDMLTLLMQPAGFEPFVNTRGQLSAINRDVTRPADITLSDNTRLISVNGSKTRATTTEVQIHWLDPKLTEVAQQVRKLDGATITAGFFQLKQHRDVVFSQDASQRARDTYLVVRQTANSGLIPFCTEEYSQSSDTTGLITVTTSFFAPLLATSSLYAWVVAHGIPDGVAALGGGVTIPQGRLIEATSGAVLFYTMMCLGTGVYEIWGTPYDNVHARNYTTAYNDAAKPWETNAKTIETDFVMDEAGAQAFAIRELIYENAAASSFNINIVDDPRIEPGDIIQLRDGSKVYVTGYSRDLSFGAPAVLEVQGFIAGAAASIGPPVVVSPSPTDPITPGPTSPPAILPAPPPIFSAPSPAPAPSPTPIVVPDNPFVSDAVWNLEIQTQQLGTSIDNSVSIDEWRMEARSGISPIVGGGHVVAYLDASGLHFADIAATPPPPGWDSIGANGTASSTGASAYTNAFSAFGHPGYWNPDSSTEGATRVPTLEFSFDGSSPGADPSHSITVFGHSGPRNFDVTTGAHGTVEIVRELDEWATGETRGFRIRHGGLFFYRLNITKLQDEVSNPGASLHRVIVHALPMYATVGGANVAVHRRLTGRGDAEDSFIDAATTLTSNYGLGAAAFGGSGWHGYKSAIYGAKVAQPWLRFEFYDDTTLQQYGVQVEDPAFAPRSWTFEVSVNGVNWTVLDTQTDVVFAANQLKKFALPPYAIAYAPGTAPPPIFATNLVPWRMLQAMPQDRTTHAAFVVGSRILHVGGQNFQETRIELNGGQEWLDPATGTWTVDMDDSLPGTLVCPTTFAYGGSQYVIGRQHNRSGVLTWEYNPTTATLPPSLGGTSSHWRYRYDIQTPWEIGDQRGALVGSKLYYPTVGICVDMAGGAPTTIANIGTITSAHYVASYSVSAIGGLVYVLGVGDIAVGGSSCRKTYIYNPATDAVTAGADCPQSLWGSTSVVFDGKVHVFGGALVDESFRPSTRHLVYDPATDTWTNKAPLPPVRYLTDGSALFGDTGQDAGGPGLTVVGGIVQPQPSRAGFSATVYGGKIYLAGGCGFIAGQEAPIAGDVSTPAFLAYAGLTLVYDPSLD